MDIYLPQKMPGRITMMNKAKAPPFKGMGRLFICPGLKSQMLTDW